MPHRHHIYAKSSDMTKATKFAYPQSDHELPYCKYLLQCCAKFPCVNIPDQETDNQYSNTTPSIRFHIYHLISRCKAHGRILLKDNNICRMCKHYCVSEKSTNIYTRKELVMIETTIFNFHTSFYIIEI